MPIAYLSAAIGARRHAERELKLGRHDGTHVMATYYDDEHVEHKLHGSAELHAPGGRTEILIFSSQTADYGRKSPVVFPVAVVAGDDAAGGFTFGAEGSSSVGAVSGVST